MKENRLVTIRFSDTEMEAIEVLLDKKKINRIPSLLRYLITKEFEEVEEAKSKVYQPREKGHTLASKKLERIEKEKEIRAMDDASLMAYLESADYFPKQENRFYAVKDGCAELWIQSSVGTYLAKSDTIDEIIQKLKVDKKI